MINEVYYCTHQKLKGSPLPILQRIPAHLRSETLAVSLSLNWKPFLGGCCIIYPFNELIDHPLQPIELLRVSSKENQLVIIPWVFA